MSRRSKQLSVAIGLVVALLVGGTVWVVTARSYGFTEERVTIPGPRGELHGILATPSSDEGPFGLIVFVSDDGPVDADDGGRYRPLWDSFAQAGFACLSWNKPGVDDAPGDWLEQTVHDRVAEVDAAIAWAHTRDDIDATRVGAWGLGQAGFVLPQVARARPDLRFVIAVDPATDWRADGAFAVREHARADGASEDEVAAELDRYRRRTELLVQGADHRTYLDSGLDDDPMSPERWDFERRNVHASAVDAVAAIGVPTLLIIGGRDRDVDTAQSDRLYTRSVPGGLLTVKGYPQAGHRITRDDLEYRPGDLRTRIRRALAPKSVYAEDYLDTLRVFARRQTQ